MSEGPSIAQQDSPKPSSSSPSSHRRRGGGRGRGGEDDSNNRGGRGSHRGGRGGRGRGSVRSSGGRGRGGRQNGSNYRRQQQQQQLQNTTIGEEDNPEAAATPAAAGASSLGYNNSDYLTTIGSYDPANITDYLSKALPPPEPPMNAIAPKLLALPKAPKTAGKHPMILSRQSYPPVDRYEEDAKILSERLAEAALCEDDDFDVPPMSEETHQQLEAGPAAVLATATEPPAEAETGTGAKDKKPKAKKNRKKVPKKSTELVVVANHVPPLSTTAALMALPAREVSITAANTVTIVAIPDEGRGGGDSRTANQSLPDSRRKKKKGGDAKANQKAARRFNLDVRACVTDSDPDRLREILHDRNNQKFALEASVLESAMKAYVVAAMFEDALYCLKHCTLPGTLSTQQTERILSCMPQNLRSSSSYTAADMITALCIATQFDTPATRTYFSRIVRGIALEFLEEAMTARDRICSAPCERLVRSGLCVVNAKLEQGRKPNEILVKPGDQLGVFVSDTMETRGIQAGDAVSILPYAGPYPMSAESLDRNMIEAIVTNSNPMVLRLQDKINPTILATLTETIDGNRYRIDKLSNRMGFNRQLTAAVAIASPIVGDGSRRPCKAIIQAITAMDENIEIVMRGTSSRTSTAELCAVAVPWDNEEEDAEALPQDQDTIRTTYRLALDKYGSLEGLNLSQQLAVEGATTQRLTLVQGPPGTGKTRIAIQILEHWARLAKAAAEPGENPKPILATSDSNIAVDNLVEGCAAVGLRVVRLGRPEAIRPELLRYCIDRPPSSYDRGSANSSSVANSYKERMKQLKGAQIICCTCIGSGADLLDVLGPLERVLVDEATQATEPAVLVPLMRGCRQLVLVGDHCQLPPTVLSTRAEEEGHHVPLFSRMVACGVPPFMLDTQYRMHPAIAMFPSDLFYGGLLKNGVSAPERRPLPGFPWPREEFPVAFIPVKGIEMDDGVSKYNELEAEAACDAVKMLLQGGKCTVSDIAVVTPYAAQARLIRRMTKRLIGATGPPYIEVSSVDGFQGREKEAVVFSAVRSNDFGQIGFTSDWRRINVSFTRARRALIVIGNDQTLRRGDPETWQPWLAWADAHGINMEKPGVGRGRYEPEQLRRVRGGTTAAEMLKDVLMRQQAQLKLSEKQQERAVKQSEGHIVGEEDEKIPEKIMTLEEDLALLENTEGNWDDSEDELDKKPATMSHSVSRTTLASATSSEVRDNSNGGGVLDIWDL